MPRANRHYLPGYAWHITHRCHKREFLLKFSRDRQRWLHWLFQAKKRYGLCVLNYIVTSNHIHLLVLDIKPGAIAQSMQLIAGRTAQEYNQRKNRRGAFWEDRYFATVVEAGSHLAKCLTYIDLNMVRAGVVVRPEHWKASGYNEIQNPVQRYRIIDRDRLIELLALQNDENLKQCHKEWVETELQSDQQQRETVWSQGLAVGSEEFVKKIRKQLGCRASNRVCHRQGDVYCIKEPELSYKVDLTTVMQYLSDIIPTI